MGFSRKYLNFSKILKVGKFAIECLSNGIVPRKSLFRLDYEVFWQEALKVGKIRNYDEKKSVFPEKKTFSSS